MRSKTQRNKKSFRKKQQHKRRFNEYYHYLVKMGMNKNKAKKIANWYATHGRR